MFASMEKGAGQNERTGRDEQKDRDWARRVKGEVRHYPDYRLLRTGKEAGSSGLDERAGIDKLIDLCSEALGKVGGNYITAKIPKREKVRRGEDSGPYYELAKKILINYFKKEAEARGFDVSGVGIVEEDGKVGNKRVGGAEMGDIYVVFRSSIATILEEKEGLKTKQAQDEQGAKKQPYQDANTQASRTFGNKYAQAQDRQYLWAQGALEFADIYATGAGGVSLRAAIERNILPIIDAWSTQQGSAINEADKQEFINYFVGMAAFLPPEKRAAFFSPNGENGWHSLASSLTTWGAENSLRYMHLLYTSVSGETKTREELSGGGVLDENRTHELLEALQTTPNFADNINKSDILAGQASDLAQNNSELNDLHARTININGRYEFLVCTAPVIAFTNRNVSQLSEIIKELAAYDDTIAFLVGDNSDSRGMRDFGPAALQNMYGLVVPAFARAEGFAGVLDEDSKLLQLERYMADNSAKLASLAPQDVKDYLSGAGYYSPIGKGDLQITPDGYLILDLRRAMNITYVYEVSAYVPDYMPIEASHVFDNINIVRWQDYSQNQRELLPAKNRRFSDQFHYDPQSGRVVDKEGKPLQTGAVVKNYFARMDGRLPQNTIAILMQEGGQDVYRKINRMSGEVEPGEVGINRLKKEGTVYASDAQYEWRQLGAAGQATVTKTTNSNPQTKYDNTSIYGHTDVEMSAVRSPKGEGESHSDEKVGLRAYGDWDTYDESTKTSTHSSGRGMFYGALSLENTDFLSAQKSLWWTFQQGIYDQTTNEATGDVYNRRSTGQYAIDHLNKDNRRLGAYYGTLEEINATTKEDILHTREDLLYNWDDIRTARQPFGPLMQAGLGLKVDNGKASKVLGDAHLGWENADVYAGAYSPDPLFNGISGPSYLYSGGLNSYLDIKNSFVMSSFYMGNGVIGIGSLSDVKSERFLRRNEVQARAGLAGSNGLWSAELAALLAQNNQDKGVMGRGHLRFGRGEDVSANALYDEAFGSGFNIRVSAPKADLWIAAYDSGLEWMGRGIDNWRIGYYRDRYFGTGNLYDKPTGKLNVAKAYISKRFDEEALREISASAAYTDRKGVENVPAREYGSVVVNFDGKRFAGFHYEKRTVAHVVDDGSGNETVTMQNLKDVRAGATVGLNLGGDLYLSGFGFRSADYETGRVSLDENGQPINVIGDENTNKETWYGPKGPMPFSVTGQYKYLRGSAALNLGPDAYFVVSSTVYPNSPYGDKARWGGGLYVNTDPYHQAQLSSIQLYGYDSYGVAYAPLGKGLLYEARDNNEFALEMLKGFGASFHYRKSAPGYDWTSREVELVDYVGVADKMEAYAGYRRFNMNMREQIYDANQFKAGLAWQLSNEGRMGFEARVDDWNTRTISTGHVNNRFTGSFSLYINYNLW
ncbi:MAG: hypothetical protein V1822_03915 [Candidatus Micrarchaeota archaeon]